MEAMNETTATTNDMPVKKTRDEMTVKRQIYTNAVKYLTDIANKEHARTGEYKAPTPQAITDECKKRWQLHLERKKGKEDISAFFE